MFESENRKSSNENRKIGIGIIEAKIRFKATQLTRRIVTALLCTPYFVLTLVSLKKVKKKIDMLAQNTAATIALIIHSPLLSLMVCLANLPRKITCRTKDIIGIDIAEPL